MRKGANRMVLIGFSSQNFDVFVLQIIEGLNGFSIFASEVLKEKQFQDPERIKRRRGTHCCYTFGEMEQIVLTLFFDLRPSTCPLTLLTSLSKSA